MGITLGVPSVHTYASRAGMVDLSSVNEAGCLKRSRSPCFTGISYPLMRVTACRIVRVPTYCSGLSCLTSRTEGLYTDCNAGPESSFQQQVRVAAVIKQMISAFP